MLHCCIMTVRPSFLSKTNPMRIIALFLIFSVFYGCKKSENGFEGYFLEFRPRAVSYVFLYPGVSSKNTYKDKEYTEYKILENEGQVVGQNFFLSINTHNVDLKNTEVDLLWNLLQTKLDEPISSLEQMIKIDYQRKANAKSASIASDKANLVEMEYRTTGIQKLFIKALDAGLFGLSAGSDLSANFEVIKYDPDFVASAQTHTLLYGFSSNDKPTAVDEWVSLKPLAQPAMYVRFKAIPPELPVSTRFVVEIVTDDDRLLADTIPSLLIVP